MLRRHQAIFPHIVAEGDLLAILISPIILDILESGVPSTQGWHSSPAMDSLVSLQEDGSSFHFHFIFHFLSHDEICHGHYCIILVSKAHWVFSRRLILLSFFLSHTHKHAQSRRLFLAAPSFQPSNCLTVLPLYTFKLPYSLTFVSHVIYSSWLCLCSPHVVGSHCWLSGFLTHKPGAADAKARASLPPHS